MSRLRSVPTLSPRKISAGYFLFGVVWIPVTDVVLAIVFASQQLPTIPGLLKGWLFIGLSTLLIFTLSRAHHRQMMTAQTKFETANQQLQVLHRVFRHNIRNDLNIIQGYTDLVSERASDTRVQDELDTIHRTAVGIIDISEKLRIVEQIDPPTAREEAVDLVALVTVEIDRLKASYPEITITTQLPDQAWIDGGESLQYAIREVLENAIAHFDKPFSRCQLSITIACEGADVVVEIGDNGPGIPEEELEAIHTQNETSLVHASSVGLWLVTWLCRLHNGSSEFSSEVGTGTTVSLRFDAATPVRWVDTEPRFRETIPNLGR